MPPIDKNNLSTKLVCTLEVCLWIHQFNSIVPIRAYIEQHCNGKVRNLLSLEKIVENSNYEKLLILIKYRNHLGI
jgi:hypothetical protein